MSGIVRTTFLAIALAMLAGGPAAAEPVLDRVKRHGQVSCGIDQTPGFSDFDALGKPIGFEVDFCRAVAAAVLGDADRITVRRVNTANKFGALLSGDIDIAFGMTTWTFNRDTSMRTVFPATLFYDGQGFMTWADQGITAAADLAGRRICVQTGTTSAANLADFIATRGLKAEIIGLGSSEEKMNAFAQRTCDAVTGDRSELSVHRARRAPAPEQWRILPEVLSREPLGPAVAQGDPVWFAVVRWAVLVTLVAETRHVDSANVAGFAQDGDGELRRLGGGESGFGVGIGLDPQWALRIVAQVGNYAEIYQRNLAPLGLPRGLNTLWTEGGLLYAPPLR
jgi:general L-amino acid transport system substrate-binding protein